MLAGPLRVALTLALVVASTTVAASAAADPAPASVAPREARTGPDLADLADLADDAAAPDDVQPPASAGPGRADAEAPATDRVVVRLRPGAGAATAAAVAAAADVDLDGEVDGLDRAWVVDTGDRDAAEVAGVLAADGRVDLAVPDHIRTVSRTPNDPLRAQQSHLGTVRATGAWARTTATGTVVAVIDTGVQATHPDLAGRVLRGLDLVDGDLDAADEEGHGTLVAGIIGAATDNGVGISGLAWDARILPVRVLDEDGLGYDSDVAAGIRWAADRGAHVINLSLGGPQGSPLLDEAVAYAIGQGSVVVAAAGNSGLEERTYPAASPGVISVAATDAQGRLTDFSTRGDWVSLAAPGFDLLSTLPTWTGYGYAWFDGTSAAAPVVSGTAALVRARSPALTPAQVASRLRTTARDAGPRGLDPFYGAGVLDAAAAVGAVPAAPFPRAAGDAREPNDLPPQATPIVADSQGIRVTGVTIAPEGDVDWYRYEVAAPTTLTVGVGYPEVTEDDARSMFPLVTLYDADLHELARSGEDGYRRGHEQATAVVEPGTYLIEVRSAWGSTSNGTYEVFIQPGAAPTARFGPAAHTPIGSWPQGATFADVTGDGQSEALVTTGSYFDPDNDHRLHVLRRTTDGGWERTARHPLETVGAGGGPIAVADLDADGTDEVLVGTSPGLRVFAREDGGLVDRGLLPGPTAPVTALGVGDVDLDGDLDVVAATDAGVVLHRGAGDGTTSPEILLPGTAASRWIDLAVGDLLGDGRLEVVGVRANQGRPLQLLTPTDDGYSHRTLTANTTTWALNGVAVGDVTGDGRDDVVVTAGGNAPSAEVGVVPGGDDDLGTLQTTRVADVPQPIELVDVTGDGRLDAITVHGGWGRLSLLEQAADGGLLPPRVHQVPTPTHVHRSGLAVADLDGDGAVEVGYGVPGGNDASFVTVPGQLPTPSPRRAPAWLVAAAPAQHATVPATPSFALDWARPLDPTSITAAAVRLVDGRTGATVAATRSYDAVARRLTVAPTAPLRANRAYQLRLDGLRDADGRHLPAPERRFVTVQKDTVAPGPVTGVSVDARQGQATLRWTRPADADLERIVVRRIAGTSAPTTSTGTEVYRGTGTSTVVTGLTGGTDHTIAVWAYDESGNVSPRASVVIRATSVAASASASTVVHGTDVVVTGHLRRAGTTTGVGPRTVDLLVRRQGATTWSRASSATTAKDGSYRFVHRPGWHAEYRVRFAGAGDHLGAESSTRKVAVRTAVTAKLSATSVGRNASVTLTGKVSPSHAGQRVTLQRQVDGVWRDVTTATLSSTSTYTFRPSTSKAGTYAYRVVKPADADHAVGTSPKVTLRVS